MPFDPLHAGAERFSALAICARQTTAPTRDEDVPYNAFWAYVGVRFPTMPDPRNPGFDVHGDAVFATLAVTAKYLCRDWSDDPEYAYDAQHRAHLTSLGTLHRECMRYAARLQARMTSGIPMMERRTLQFIEQSTLELGYAALVPPVETGDCDALAALATAGEERVFEIPALLPFCVGARAALSDPGWPNLEWLPEMGALGIIGNCITKGERILNRRERELDVAEDRGGIVRRAIPTGRQGPHPGPSPAEQQEAADVIDDLLYGDVEEEPGALVFPADVVDAAGKSENRSEIKKTLGMALGARLPLVPVPEDWDAWETGLAARAPWLAAVPRALRAEQGGRAHWGHTVLCVVGPPGAGKTRLIRDLAEASGLHYARINAESASDTSTFGTPIRWASSQCGVIERAMVSARSATSLVHYDELEKSSGSRQSNSGKITDLLHGLWEPETAQSWRSVWLGVPIDAGHLVHVVTVNSLDGLPGSLVDRMRVVHVGEPGPEHLPALAGRVAVEACHELGLDPRWGTLDGEELAALAEAWPGGSVRRLQRLVAGILRARDGAPGPRH